MLELGTAEPMSPSHVSTSRLLSQKQPTWLNSLKLHAHSQWRSCGSQQGDWFRRLLSIRVFWISPSCQFANLFSVKEPVWFFFFLPRPCWSQLEKCEFCCLSQRDRRLLSPGISVRQYRRVVMAHLFLRLRDLRGKLPLRGDCKDQLLLQRKEEENYLASIRMLRNLARTK